MVQVAVIEQEKREMAFSQEDVETIKKTVAKGASDSELKMFLHLCKRYELDPFLKEIWFIKYGGKDAVIMTSRDGYLKVAQNHPEYIGPPASFVVCEGDTFEIDAQNYAVMHKFGAERGKILGAWAKCDRKGKNPAICFVKFDEYKGNSNIWKQYPSAMIQKVAEAFVLKRQFGISGLVTKEEMDAREPEEIEKIEMMTEEQKQTLAKLKEFHGFGKDELEELKTQAGIESWKTVTKDQADILIDIMGKTEKEEEEEVSDSTLYIVGEIDENGEKIIDVEAEATE